MDTPVITYKGPAILARAVLGVGMAGLLLVSGFLPGYPLEWRALLPLIVLGASLWTLPAGYFLTIAALAFPIWGLSPYLATLFLVATIIPHRPALAHLPLALLIAWTPVLAGAHLDILVLLLAGVLGGLRYGAVAGGVAALWLKLYAALSGNSLDLLTLNGTPGSPGAIAARFAGAGSLQTLQLVAFPFAPNAGELLLNLLQIAAFAAAGGAAGWLAAWGRGRLVLNDLQDTPTAARYIVRRFAWSALLPVVAPALALAALLLLLPLAIAHPLSELGFGGAIGSILPRILLGAIVTLGVMIMVLTAQPLPPLPRQQKKANLTSSTKSAPAPRQVPTPKAASKPTPKPQLDPLPDLSGVKTGRYVPSWAASAGVPALPPERETGADSAGGAYRDRRPTEPEIAIELD